MAISDPTNQRPTTRTVRLLSTSNEKTPLRELAQGHAIPFLNSATIEHLRFLVVFEGEAVVGVAGLVLDSHRVPGCLGIGFVSTHCEHRNQGVASLLAQELFDLARRRQQGIANTRYKPDGVLWLRPVLQRLALRYPEVPLFELP